jgi:glycosyltransferase involved in cell wall biosynthesis
MIGHLRSPRKKVLVHRILHLRRRIDRVVVYASTQRAVAVDTLGYPPEHVVLSPFMVDTAFWADDRVTADLGSRPMLCSVGLELRDYPTLVESVRDLDVDVVVAASSPWSKRRSTAADVDLPPNVRVAAFTQFDLRQLYADSAFVVVPLEETDFQAGITTILEAMSMSRAVICTRTAGQIDTVVDGENGVYVPPGDVAALRDAIRDLAADPERARRMGEAGRAWAQREADVQVYAKRLAALVHP